VVVVIGPACNRLAEGRALATMLASFGTIAFKSVLAGLLIAFLASCAPWQPAPVETRSERRPTGAAPARQEPAPANYEIRRGDTLYSIAFRFGLDWREVAGWNRLDPPYTIRPGQLLRLTAPPQSRPPAPPVVAQTRPAADSRPEPGSGAQPPVPAAPERPASHRSSEASTSPRSDRPAPAVQAEQNSSNSATRQAGGVSWRWPTAGSVARPFDSSATRRGLGIRGQVGQAVVAAADGEVVYSGTALIGYGELIIIKHSATMLSAYGHNRQRLVAEGDRVRAGQPIAELGLDETDEAILHFEIRRNGQPENPLSYLPAR